MAPFAGLVGHGGTGGLIVEISLVLAVAVPLALVWLRERRRGREGPRRPGQLRDDDDV